MNLCDVIFVYLSFILVTKYVHNKYEKIRALKLLLSIDR